MKFIFVLALIVMVSCVTVCAQTDASKFPAKSSTSITQPGKHKSDVVKRNKQRNKAQMSNIRSFKVKGVSLQMVYVEGGTLRMAPPQSRAVTLGAGRSQFTVSR